MGARGPLPKSLKLHQMEGTRARSKTGDGLALPVERPRPPTFLTEEGAREFERLCEDLHGAGVLASLDGDLLGVLANALAEYRQLSADIGKVKIAEAIATGLVKYRDKAAATIARLSKEFGLSPAARLRLKPPGGGKEDGAKTVMSRKRG